MQKRFHIFLGLGTLLFFIISCSDPVEKWEPTDPFEFPSHFPAPHYQNQENPLTEAGISFGKALFYDPILSRDSSISCGSCHEQASAFSDSPYATSAGIDGQRGTRNAPPMFNLAWNTSFMWDGGINHIEFMPLGPIENGLEMDENISQVVNKLNASPRYRLLSKWAFQTEEITASRMLYALAQFMSSMISANAKFDQYILGEASLTTEEEAGYLLVQEHCASCHPAPLFTNYAFINNGLDSTFSDLGRMRINLNPADEGKFKVPSLRNVEVSGPYMHDGRFNTLEEVLQHYSSGIVPSHSLHPGLSNMNLSAAEQQQIISFLKSLTDQEFLTNADFAPLN